MTEQTSTPKKSVITRTDRLRGLELAVKAIEGRNFTYPGNASVAIAEQFANFLATGETGLDK